MTGFEKVKTNILKNKVAFIIEAADAANDSSRKMEAVSSNLETIKVYSIEDLDTALNKEKTVYLAILKSKISDMVYQNIKRYQTFLEN